jgi:hypothetical protein
LFPCLKQQRDALPANPQLPFAVQNLLGPEPSDFSLTKDYGRNCQRTNSRTVQQRLGD